MTVRNKFARLLTVLGLLAWVPFIYLSVSGQEPSIFPYLTVHLIGVIGGSQLRRKSSAPSPKNSRRQVAGRILIILGVLAWVPYLYQKEILSQPTDMAPYLIVHLTGVLSGIAMLLSIPLLQYWASRHPAADQHPDDDPSVVKTVEPT